MYRHRLTDGQVPFLSVVSDFCLITSRAIVRDVPADDWRTFPSSISHTPHPHPLLPEFSSRFQSDILVGSLRYLLDAWKPLLAFSMWVKTSR